ncbi:MAG: transporter substrate-binding domain-containing protein [Fidelibacterota bacterium]
MKRYLKKIIFHSFPSGLICKFKNTFYLIIILLSITPLRAEYSQGKETIPIIAGCEYDYPPYCFIDADSHATGFSVELMQAALKVMGRDVVFRLGPWADVKDWLAKGEVDALPLVGRTPEREEIYDFTFPYLSMHGAIIVHEDTHDVEDLSDLRGRKVAVMKGDNAVEFLRREGRGLILKTTQTFKDALLGLSEKKYDAVVVQRIVGLRLIQELGLKNLRVVSKPIYGFRQDFCFAVQEGDRETLALLNEGLSLVIADGTFRYLHSRWFSSLELPSHRKIIVGGDYHFPPYEFLDEEGNPSGFNVDLIHAIAREMDLDVEIQLAPWTEIRDGLLKGNIDLIQGMFYSHERDLLFDFTQPHAMSHYVTVVRKEAGKPPESVADLKAFVTAVEDGDIMHEFAIENGLKDQIKIYHN